MSHVFQLHHDNEVDKSTATFEVGYGSYSGTLPLANLKDPRVHKFAQTSDATLASTKFRINLGVVKTFRGIFLTHTNLSSAATYRITLYSDSGYTTIINQTSWLPINGYPDIDPFLLGSSIWHLYDEDISALYVQVEINDTANTDGYHRYGRLFIPSCYEPPYNYSEGSADDLIVNTQVSNALGGAPFYVVNTPARNTRLNCSRFPSSEKPPIRNIRMRSGVDKQVVLIPNPDDTANYYQRNYVGRLQSLPSLQALLVDDVSVAFDVIEVVP